MDGYVENLLIKFKHPRPTKQRLSPYKCAPIAYGIKTQLNPEVDFCRFLMTTKQRIQEIIDSLL